MTNNIVPLAAEYGVSLPAGAENQFLLYQELMLAWNEKINLTAITDPEGILHKHFLDSLLPLAALALADGASLIDVGTGAGFPGVPLKIARPDISLTLLDSLRKRTDFLRELSRELGQDNHIVHGRAEQLSRDPLFRERFDIATARAVAALPALCEYCLPYVKPGGRFIALKGPDAGEEAEHSRAAIRLLGGELAEIKTFTLPGGDRRSIVTVKKISQTPTKYPRTGVKISKSPL